jgi:hypothetical protein
MTWEQIITLFSLDTILIVLAFASTVELIVLCLKGKIRP